MFAEVDALRARTRGHPEVVVAVLDGPVDLGHPCFEGALLSPLPTLVQEAARPEGRMAQHGTHVASVLFGQAESLVPGLAPACRGLVVPVFSEGRRLSQLDLARAIEQALAAGAQFINISGGQLVDDGAAEPWLVRAVERCAEQGAVVVAAAGNDGCRCLHVPAALPAVLAVGAADAAGRPLPSSNWGDAYASQGVLAPGTAVLGALPGGGSRRASGTSFATPVVTGVLALLASLARAEGCRVTPARLREVLIATARPCSLAAGDDRRRCLVGHIDVPRALHALRGEPVSEELASPAHPSGCSPAGASGACGCGGAAGACACATQPYASEEEEPDVVAAGLVVEPAAIAAVSPAGPRGSGSVRPHAAARARPRRSAAPRRLCSTVEPSQAGAQASLIYAIGSLGYDFASEARRDSFKQLMPPFDIDGTQVPANPHDARQMVDYLGQNLAEARSLVWTVNLELTPVYAIEPTGPFARDVYQVLQQLLAGQVLDGGDPEFIERISVPGRRTGRSVRLFSGQVVPLVEIDSPRGMFGWKVNTLVEAALQAVGAGEAEQEASRNSLSSFLNRVYYDLRNFGESSQDRALNFAATNAFQAAQTFSSAVGAGMELESIEVTRSPVCRPDSDCWDVLLKFFDAENMMRARRVFRFTVDVSDLIPVTLGKVRSWSAAY